MEISWSQNYLDFLFPFKIYGAFRDISEFDVTLAVVCEHSFRYKDKKEVNETFWTLEGENNGALVTFHIHAANDSE